MDPVLKEYYRSKNGTEYCRNPLQEEIAVLAYVESKWAVIAPGVRVVESIIDYEIQQVTPVPRVDSSVGSSAQISFPLSLGKSSLAPV